MQEVRKGEGDRAGEEFSMRDLPAGPGEILDRVTRLMGNAPPSLPVP